MSTEQSNREIRVLKFGGSSLADKEALFLAADIVKTRYESGLSVVVVVSARGGTTDSLLQDVAPFAASSPRELDMLLTSGERISAAIFAMTLASKDVPAISLTGSQAGIITDGVHTNARILEVRPTRVKESLERGKVVVVGGFQGVSYQKEITTLGRGGSDVTAAALAAELGAKVCEIFSDVEGVYSANPSQVSGAKQLPEMRYEEMQALGEAGAKVLHPRAVEFAKNSGVKIECKSTFDGEGKTTVIHGFEQIKEHRIVGVASEKSVSLLELNGLSHKELHSLLESLQHERVIMKQFAFSMSDAECSGTLVLSHNEKREKDILFEGVTLSSNLSAVSLVGEGITEYASEVLSALQLLHKHGFVPRTMHTTSYRISFIVDASSHDAVVDLLHTFYCAPE
ncbi:aspartate kinase [bacterium]|nr:aspartate kinase [bacterium]